MTRLKPSFTFFFWGKMLALLKTNEAIKALEARRAAGETLDPQQASKVARRDEVLLSLDALIEENPTEAEALMQKRERNGADAAKRATTDARARALDEEAAR